MNKEEIINKIIELAFERRDGNLTIKNKEIYQKVTNKKRFSEKSWSEIIPILKQISYKTYRGFQFVPFSPMIANQYNFKLGGGIITKYCAGFTLFKVKHYCNECKGGDDE